MTRNESDLPEKEHAWLIENAPLVSIDLIVKNSKGQVLLLKRKENPAKGYWFTPGRRMRKTDLNFETTFNRIIEKELKLKKKPKFKNAIYVGPFEHPYKNENRYDIPGISTYYLSHAYEITISENVEILEDDTEHSKSRWFEIDELKTSRDVHDFTKGFFKKHYTVPDDSGMYRALVSNYLHNDRLLWSRTQILLAIQGAALISGYSFRSHWSGPAIMIGASLLILIVWILIDRDITISRVNETVIDELSDRIFKNRGEKRVVSLRSEPRHKWLRGQTLIQFTIILLILLNICLSWAYIERPTLFPLAPNTAIEKLEDQLRELSNKTEAIDYQLKMILFKISAIEKDLPDTKNVESQIKEISSTLSSETKKHNDQLKVISDKLKSLEIKHQAKN